MSKGVDWNHGVKPPRQIDFIVKWQFMWWSHKKLNRHGVDSRKTNGTRGISAFPSIHWLYLTMG